MDKLQYGLKQLCDRNRDGSYSTQSIRARSLSQIAAQLKELGYRKMTPQSLKPKHVEALVKHWKEQALSDATMKNKMSHIRWWAEKVNKAPVVARDNSHYGIKNRVFSSNVSKAVEISQEQLNRIQDQHLKLSLELQRDFGLRREEALKFNPRWADRGDHVQLKGSWTKGGRERSIEIRNEQQRDTLDRAKSLAGLGSMIPADRKYVQQLRLYEKHTVSNGLSKLHGLRHLYAQTRYEEITGHRAPAQGGPTVKELTPDQKVLDHKARTLISEELGHCREQITTVYLGR